MKWLVYFLESDFDLSFYKELIYEDARQFLIRREILRSIAIHSCPDIYHLNSGTYSFLLILCDDLQEWDRPTFHELRESRNIIIEVKLNQYTRSKIDATIKYIFVDRKDFDKDMESHLKCIYKRLHKILRSALDVDDRQFTYQWKIVLKIIDPQSEHTIILNNTKTEAKLSLDDKPLVDWLYSDTTKLYDIINPPTPTSI
jgi:hypothetical protein